MQVTSSTLLNAPLILFQSRAVADNAMHLHQRQRGRPMLPSITVIIINDTARLSFERGFIATSHALAQPCFNPIFWLRGSVV